MAQRSVVWTLTAAKQRREILKYWTIRNGSKEYAEKLILKTKDIIDLICAHPSAFKATNFPETRMATFGNFSIFFKATEQEIIITAFWDQRQDPAKILELLQSESDQKKPK
jgi:plasmid stabilization system protein ParE